MSAALHVRDLMSHQVVTLRRDDQLTLADRVMSLGRIRHMPVVDEDGRLVGIVSQRDLFRGALARALGQDSSGHQRLLKSLRVEEVMATRVLTTTTSTPLSEAAEQMVTHKVGCLPVVDEGRLVGILTEGDFVAAFARGGPRPG
jgi:CBS domain-containing protein